MSELAAKGEQRVESRRLQNSSLRIASEIVLESSMKDDLREKELKSLALQQDEALARVLEAKQTEEEQRRREIQRICEEDESLRSLQLKLKAAYMNKERTAQIKEKEAIGIIEKEKTRRFDEMDEYYRRMALAEENEKKIRLMKENLATRSVLTNQILEKERMIEEEAHAQWLKDKDEIDQIVKKIHMEDQQESDAKKKKQHDTKLYIEQYQKERNAFLARKKFEQDSMDRQIAKYAKEKEDREAGVVAKKAADLAFQEGLYNKLKDAAERKMREENEMLEFREILQTEENEERLRKDAESRRLKQEKSIKEMMDANEMQKRLKEEISKKAAADEEVLVAKMRAKFEADEAKERLQKQMRDQAKVNYKMGVEAQRKQLREMYEAEVKAESAARELEAEKSTFRERVVEEARRRLLEEHAALLKDHLPKGVIKSEEDLKYLGSNTFLT